MPTTAVLTQGTEIPGFCFTVLRVLSNCLPFRKASAFFGFNNMLLRL